MRKIISLYPTTEVGGNYFFDDNLTNNGLMGE